MHYLINLGLIFLIWVGAFFYASWSDKRGIEYTHKGGFIFAGVLLFLLFIAIVWRF